jgi:thymidylate synthase (FAD)
MTEVILDAWTQSTRSFEDCQGLVAYYARVSNPGQPSRTNDRLIKYLIEHKHWSPFDMVDVVLDVRLSRTIGRQFLRHSSLKFQEFSQRYSATETVTNFPKARMQDTSNRQNSLECTDEGVIEWFFDAQKAVVDLSFCKYDEALKRGVAKELARDLLPEGLTHSRMFAKGSIRSWIHYVDVRTGPETQKEHRELASMCANEIAKVFPLIQEFNHVLKETTEC